MLSFICPTIRIENLQKLYDSIATAFNDSWEIIFVGPYLPSKELLEKENVKYIKDSGSPVRAQQIGLCNAQGEYITRAVDDGIYLPESLTKAFELIDKNDYKSMACLKFVEGESAHLTHKDDFYQLSYHLLTLRRYVPYYHKLINFGIYSSKLLQEVGGWDAKTFESIALAELDLSIRLQWYGAKVAMSKGICIRCDWEPGTIGTHGPVHHSCLADQSIFNKIYDEPECENRTRIDINNWLESSERWERRFNE